MQIQYRGLPVIFQLLFIFLVALGFINSAWAKPLRIGILSPLSGPLRVSGIDLFNGAKLAVEETKQAQAPLDIELIPKDDECEPAIGAESAQHLIAEDEVAIALGAPCPSVGKIVTKVFVESRIPFIRTGPFSPKENQQNATQQYVINLGVNLDITEMLAQQLASDTGVNVDFKTCTVTYAPDASQEAQAMLCPALSVPEKEWSKFSINYRQRYNGEMPSASTLMGYVATKIAIDSLHFAKGIKSEVHNALMTQPFETILGVLQFKAKQNFEPSLHVVIPDRISESERSTIIEKVKDKTKKKCDDCKKSECPQGTVADLILDVSKEEKCCKKQNSECPQGSFIWFR